MNTKYYFTSDLHFFHKNICKFTGRPFSSVEEMNQVLIKNINDTVASHDILWSLGDFSFGNINQTKSVLRQINCRLHMVTGNHCGDIFTHRKELIKEQLVKEIVPYKEIVVERQKINLFHYGGRIWNGSHKGYWLLFGHSHNDLPPYGKSVDVGVDSTAILDGKTDYKPFSFDEIKTFMDKQPIIGNHHR